MMTRWHQSGLCPWSLALGAALVVLVCVSAVGRAGVPCDGWSQVATPNVGNRTNYLTGVTFLSANDAWSVGLWRDVSGVFGPMAMRWNGSSWSLASLPSTSHLGGLPEAAGVDAASNGDVWVVGHVFSGYPSDNLPLLLRWRAGSWDYVATAALRPQTVHPFAARGGLAYEVNAIAPDDIWTVGQGQGFGVGATTVPMALHWNGSSWIDVDVPSIANRHHSLDDVVAISHDDVWAVGDYRNVAGAFHAVTYHWNGTAWSHVDSPIEHMAGDSGLDDVAASGPNDVWAIGGSSLGVVLMHWDGSQWSLAQPPPNSGGSIVAVGPNDLWVSGWNGFWHWDGATWTEVPTSVPGASYVIRNGGFQVVGDCDIWCAGYWTLADGTTSFTLAERLQPAAATSAVTEVLAPNPVLVFRNPFPPGSPIRFETPSARPARLTLYDGSGRKVRTLFESSSTIGTQSLTWNGLGEAGELLPRGVYFLRLEAGGKSTTRKLVLLRSDK